MNDLIRTKTNKNNPDNSLHALFQPNGSACNQLRSFPKGKETKKTYLLKFRLQKLQFSGWYIQDSLSMRSPQRTITQKGMARGFNNPIRIPLTKLDSVLIFRCFFFFFSLGGLLVFFRT